MAMSVTPRRLAHEIFEQTAIDNQARHSTQFSIVRFTMVNEMVDPWASDPLDEDSLAPPEDNLMNLVDEGQQKELQRLKEKNSKLKSETREEEYVRKANKEFFDKELKEVEQQYRDAKTEHNMLKLRAIVGREELEKQNESVKMEVAEKDREIEVLQSNMARFQVYLENEHKEVVKMAEQEEKKANQEMQKVLNVAQQAKKQLADTRIKAIKKRQDAYKRLELFKRVQMSTNVAEEDGTDLHAPLPASEEQKTDEEEMESKDDCVVTEDN